MRRAPRIGIVGARRARQGLGPFVAKWLARHGADVVAHAGTSEATIAAASADLARLAGVHARGYVGVAALLEGEDLDAAAILSPPEHHGEALDACLAAGLHVLCEKPLLLPSEPRAADVAVARVRAYEDAFAARGLLLWENCQWPHTLPAFRALFPAAPPVPRAFAMGLEPASHGAAMLTDALSHPLSLLQALLGAALVVDGISAQADRVAGSSVPDVYDLSFRAVGPRGTAEARVVLRHNAVQPRRAWFALDGHHAERTLRLDDYSMQLTEGEAAPEQLAAPPRPAGAARSVPLPDPLEAHLAAFLAALAASDQGTPERALVPVSRACSARMAALASLTAAASAAGSASHR
jgi:predicted dehydrogenase